jgi:hypothetical protein
MNATTSWLETTSGFPSKGTIAEPRFARADSQYFRELVLVTHQLQPEQRM